MSAGSVVFCAMPFGYGPAAKVLAIAREARARGLHTIFLGHGIAHELAARSASLFAEIVDATAAEPVAAALIDSAALVVSGMDREFAALAQQRRKPFCVVDSLLWMRDRVPEPLRAAQRYWAQRFAASERVAGLRSDAVLVGPIVRGHGECVTPLRPRLVINLGGAASPDATNAPYAHFITRGVLESGLPDAIGGETVLMGGTQRVEELRRSFGNAGIDFVSLSHHEALGALASASVVLTSPGLTVTLECFQMGVPTFFLPPQSYSQWCTLRVLRAAGLAPGAFHWEDRWPGPWLDIGLPEAVRNPAVHSAIAALSADDAVRGAFAAALAGIPACDGTALAAAQRAFFAGLGPNGARTIAAELANVCAREGREVWRGSD